MRLWAAFLRFNRVRNGRTTVFLSGNMQIRFLFVSTSGYVPPFLQGVKSQWSTCLDLVSGPGCPDEVQPPSMIATSSSTILVTWENPVNNGATITVSRLADCALVSSMLHQVFFLDATTHRYNRSGLSVRPYAQ